MAKSPTLSIFQDTYHPKADGKCAISLRITFNGRKRYYSILPIKYQLDQEEYKKLFTPKPREEYRNVLKILRDEEKKASEIIDKLGDKFSFTLFDKMFAKKTGDGANMFALLEERIKELKKDGRISTGRISECTLNSLKEFHSKSKLILSEINFPFLTNYKKWMEGEGNSSTTIGMYLRNVRTVYNQAIQDGTIAQELYPFGKGKDKFKIPTGRNVKKALSLADIGRIYNYKATTDSQQKAKDFWMLSYLGNGINVKDIALLKIKNIDGDMIRFERAKTKRANEDKPVIISFPLGADIKKIISRWGKKSINREDYIFPILTSGVTPEEEYKLIQLFTHFINSNMKKISIKLKLGVHITTYVARHSFSTILRNSGISVEAISEALGHSSLKTTQNYLAGFEDDAKKKNAKKLTNFPKQKAA